MHCNAIRYVQHYEAVLERGVCELSHSFFFSIIHFIAERSNWLRKLFISFSQYVLSVYGVYVGISKAFKNMPKLCNEAFIS